MKQKILKFLKHLITKIQQVNQIDVLPESKFGNNWFGINSVLKGQLMVGSNVSCVNSVLKGHLIIGDNVRFSDAVLEGIFNIGKGSRIMGGVRLVGNVSLGKYTSLNGPNMDIEAAINKVTIGNFCSIARNVSIQEFNHDFGRMTSYFVRKNLEKKPSHEDIISKGEITIGHDVWIGTQSVILSGATIGTGAVIAANSVVTGYIPPYAIAAGSPARVIKYRFDENTIAELLKSEWWNKEEQDVLKLYHAFNKSAKQQ